MNIVSIKENSDFKRLYYRGKSEVRKRIVVYYRKNKLGFNRLGITVSPKVGKAVRRNKIRRLIKENYRLLPLDFSGYDVVIVARRSAAFSDYHAIGKDMHDIFFKLGFLKKG